MPKAVIFDLFETLITEWGHEKYTKRNLAEDLGVPQKQFRELWDSLHEKQYRGGITFEESARYVCSQCGTYVDTKTLAYVAARRKTTKAKCFDFLHPEIVPMLVSLREKGLKLCILSNCSGEEVETVRESIFAPLVDAMILSHETGFCKPEAEIYRLAANTLGVHCEECIFIGDGGSRELYGAAEVKMKPYRAMWYIRQMPIEIIAMPEFPVLESPKEVLQLFAGKTV